ncbi:MAG: glycosyltransferase family 39 protein [Deltaproteobacteria bacterium]|nr:glycosyltransferase family 39 protein [Deltaproteobacteria bacterium]
MINIVQISNSQTAIAEHDDRFDRLASWLPWIVFACAIFILFFQLGAAPLFEPDEGRNSEKAREILVLQDWVTPHDNFHPVLDKPIFFYWLIALSLKLLGISEWAARLPSALAALGCVGLVYFFARDHWGRWPALWSALILLTSAEFFILARIVIFDMPLTFFLTLALCAFYDAGHCENLQRRRGMCLLLYSALGAATLIKGLIGIVVPGMVIFAYLLLTRQWAMLRRIYLLPGVLLFLLLVLPWYLEVGARHDGYLRYYFWDEHFGRFASDEFDRSQPWYYFIVVGLVGLFPWTLLLPTLLAGWRRKALDDKTLFVVLWAALPLLFFSLSRSKLPHYILPIFPALSLLIAVPLVNLCRESPKKAQRALLLTLGCHGLVACYFVIGIVYPAILPRTIGSGVSVLTHPVWLYGIMVAITLTLLACWQATRKTFRQEQLFVVQACALVASLAFVAQVISAPASARSAKGLAEKAAAMVRPDTQVVFYDTFQSGMAFYLRAEKPLWVVTYRNKKRTFLGNFYALGKRAEPIGPRGRALLDFDEFREQWKSVKRPMVILVKEKNRARLEAEIGAAPKQVGMVNDYVVLWKP